MQINILNENGAVTFYGTNPVGNSYFGEYGKSGKFYVTSNGLINIFIDKDSYQIPWEDLLVNNVVPVDLEDAIDLLSQIFSDTPPSPTPLAVGDPYQGGIIYYIDGSGQHGLIKAIDADLGITPLSNTGIYKYSQSLTITTGATDIGIGFGQLNTNKILAADPSSEAALFCANYSKDGYNDWYLPSSDELATIYSSGLYPDFVSLGSQSGDSAWSSTEDDAANAYLLSPSFNVLPVLFSKDLACNIIPVRTF
jgi:hypothetical protein